MIEIRHADYSSINAGELEFSGRAINTIYIEEDVLWICTKPVISEITFESCISFDLTKEFNSKTTDKAVKEAEITRLTKVVSDLIAGGICQSCNRKLDDVDNSEHIAKHELEIEKLNQKVNVIAKPRTGPDVCKKLQSNGLAKIKAVTKVAIFASLIESQARPKETSKALAILLWFLLTIQFWDCGAYKYLHIF